MPIYEYLCPKCGKFEVLHKMDEVYSSCEKCGSSEVRKLISPPRGFIFKGSGFYATDYKGGKDGQPNESSSFGGLPPHPNRRENTLAKEDSGGADFAEVDGKAGTTHEKEAPSGPDYQMPDKI